MERMDGSIISQGEGYIKEDFFMTYSEDEKQENDINRNNAGLILKPKFIPMYPELLYKGFTIIESCIYGFIDFFLSNNDKFYCTNEQLARLLNVGETVVSLGIKKLKDKGLIEVGYKIKAGGGKIRFIKLKNKTFEIGKSDYGNLKGIDNKVIENKVIDRETPTKNIIVEDNRCLNSEGENFEKMGADLTFLKNVYPNIYGCNDKKALKHLELKIENGCDIDKMIEQARLLKLEVRVKIIESRYVKKLENWILDYVDCDDIDGKVKGIIKAYRSMIDGGHTFKLNPINDLKEMYGKEKVNELWKDCNTNKIVLNLK